MNDTFSTILDKHEADDNRQAKADMERLGFTDYDEYLDYLEFIQRKAAMESDIEM